MFEDRRQAVEQGQLRLRIGKQRESAAHRIQVLPGHDALRCLRVLLPGQPLRRPHELTDGCILQIQPGAQPTAQLRDRARQRLVRGLLVLAERNSHQRDVERCDHSVRKRTVVPEAMDHAAKVWIQPVFVCFVWTCVRGGESQPVLEPLTQCFDERRCSVAVALVRDEEAGLVVSQQRPRGRGIDDRNENVAVRQGIVPAIAQRADDRIWNHQVDPGDPLVLQLSGGHQHQCPHTHTERLEQSREAQHRLTCTGHSFDDTAAVILMPGIDRLCLPLPEVGVDLRSWPALHHREERICCWWRGRRSDLRDHRFRTVSDGAQRLTIP